MAVHPRDGEDPIRAEALRLLDEDPELASELEDFERRLDAGQVPASELVSHNELRRRLGLPPSDVLPPDPDH